LLMLLLFNDDCKGPNILFNIYLLDWRDNNYKIYHTRNT
jgi:hypothetical protein